MTAGTVTPVGTYGNATANSANVVYPFGSFHDAASAAHQVSTKLSEFSAALAAQATAAAVGWTGPLSEVFAAKADVLQRSCANQSSAATSLASGIASAWSAARGQQDRINFARYVQSEIEDDNLLENFVEYFGGEDDYGPPPANPEVPGAHNGYAPTRRPMYPNFGP